MELIKRLGVRKNKSGNNVSYAVFKCPFCFQEVEKDLSSGKRDKSCGCISNELKSVSLKGKKKSENHKQKMKENHADFNGVNNPMFGKRGEECPAFGRTKEKHPMYGKHRPEETKRKIGESNKGKTLGKVFTKEHRQNISKARKGRFAGENSPSWQGGKSFEIYPKEFKQIKKSILERDNYMCQFPNCTEIHDRLHVHHIDYNKKNNNPENLITLGTSCHTRTNGKNKRNYWTEFYKNIMRNKI